MDSLLSRHRNAVVLVAVLFLQLVLLAFQVKRDQDVPLIRIWAVAVITPVEKASSSVIRGLVGLWRDYVDLRQARQENRHLIEEIGRLKLVHHRLQEEAREGPPTEGTIATEQSSPLLGCSCLGHRFQRFGNLARAVSRQRQRSRYSAQHAGDYPRWDRR